MERSEIRGFLDSFHFIQATKLTRKFIEKVMHVLLSFPRKRESRTLANPWIPGRASYRQLARNDV